MGLWVPLRRLSILKPPPTGFGRINVLIECATTDELWGVMTSQRPTASGRWFLVAGACAIVVGSALWAGQVGPWIGRKPAEGSSGGTDRLATEMQTVTVSLRPPPVSAPASVVSGSSAAAMLYVLGAVLLVAVLFMVAWFLRHRPDAIDRSRPALTSEPPLVDAPLLEPDPVFDVRVAAD